MQKARLLVAGTHSGCGKTTVTCALMRAFSRKHSVAAFKCGPDYIDPMFHTRALNLRSRNLDAFLCGEDTVRMLLCAHEYELAVIEGVMGMYDGACMENDFASSNNIAMITKTPSVLVVNSEGIALSGAAVVKGYKDFMPNTLSGVILNNCTTRAYPGCKKAIEDRCDLPVFGFLPKMQEAKIRSRHLGLVTAGEIEGMTTKLDAMANAATQDIDLDALYKLACTAPAIEYSQPDIREIAQVRIAVAIDPAFCFYYQDGLDLLARLGAEIVPFSPLRDSDMPERVDGLYLGGGYPELYAEELEDNSRMRAQIKQAVEGGMPTIAECGGFMYLHERMQGANGKYYAMTGVIKGETFMTGKAKRFGYASLTADKDNLLCAAGDKINVHEYHYSDSTSPGSDMTMRKLNGRSWQCGYATETLFALYPHLHLWGNPGFAERFVKACAAGRRA